MFVKRCYVRCSYGWGLSSPVVRSMTTISKKMNSSTWQSPTPCFASCLPGLEPFVEAELLSLLLENRRSSDVGQQHHYLKSQLRVVPGGVEFSAQSPQELMRVGLWLGTATNLLVRLGSFKCRALSELEKKARREVEWRRWLRPGQPFEVHATARKSKLVHTGAITERVEREIARALSTEELAKDGIFYGKTALAEWKALPLSAVLVRFEDDCCTISLDTAPGGRFSAPLYRRGYRHQLPPPLEPPPAPSSFPGRANDITATATPSDSTEGLNEATSSVDDGSSSKVTKAPLREDIAHAMVLASILAHKQKETEFEVQRQREQGVKEHAPPDSCSSPPPTHGSFGVFDPFCGSGTLAIEAAGLLLRLPPGRLRDPPLCHLPAVFNAEAWGEVTKEAHFTASSSSASSSSASSSSTTSSRPLRLLLPWSPSPFQVCAGDRDAGAVQVARRNALRAGVAHAISFTCAPLRSHPWLSLGTAPDRGVLVTNPPWGRRLRADKKTTKKNEASNKGKRGGDGSTGGNMVVNGLKPLYQSLGFAFQSRLGGAQESGGVGWTASVLAHDIGLARSSGLDFEGAAFSTQHGGLSVACLITALPSKAISQISPNKPQGKPFAATRPPLPSSSSSSSSTKRPFCHEKRDLFV